MSNNWEKIKNIDKHCFACGLDNKQGLQMEFESDGEKLRSKLVVPNHLRGWSNLVHGGILSTIIDETMSWSAIHLLKRFILTKNMKVNFLKPVRVGEKLTVSGYIVEHHHDRQVTMKAEIFNEAGEVCANGSGEFVLFTKEQFEKLHIVESELLDEMASTF